MEISMRGLTKTLSVSLCGLLAGLAQAQTISGTDIRNDYYNGSYSNSFSVGAQSPWDATPDLDLKSQDGFTGVGVQGMTNGEIDWRNGASESITLTFTAPTSIGSFTLGLLFNGPEYNDVREVAHITANGQSYYLKTTGTEDVASWYHGDTFLRNVNYIGGAGTQSGQGGAISLSNPFGNMAVNSMTFAASEGFNLGGCGSSPVCTNQSDYNVVSVTAVPEPQTYALMLAGLGAMAFVARRRRPVG
jgi:hypothetical protein